MRENKIAIRFITDTCWAEHVTAKLPLQGGWNYLAEVVEVPKGCTQVRVAQLLHIFTQVKSNNPINYSTKSKKSIW